MTKRLPNKKRQRTLSLPLLAFYASFPVTFLVTTYNYATFQYRFASSIPSSDAVRSTSAAKKKKKNPSYYSYYGTEYLFEFLSPSSSHVVQDGDDSDDDSDRDSERSGQQPQQRQGEEAAEAGLQQQQQQHLPLPLQVIERYKEWHSEESLRRSPRDRQFLVGYYSCPTSAGNRIHEFMNGTRCFVALLPAVDADWGFRSVSLGPFYEDKSPLTASFVFLPFSALPIRLVAVNLCNY